MKYFACGDKVTCDFLIYDAAMNPIEPGTIGRVVRTWKRWEVEEVVEVDYTITIANINARALRHV